MIIAGIRPVYLAARYSTNVYVYLIPRRTVIAAKTGPGRSWASPDNSPIEDV